jgi:copper chaperone CopZ
MMTKISMKWCILFLCLICSLAGMAQFKSAVVGVDGLTCSACAFATEKSLLKLDVIDSVFMQLEENTATLFFKPGKKVDMTAVAKKITDAGFSVRSLTALVDVGQLRVTPDYCWPYENDIYHFIKLASEKELKGVVQLTFVGEKFMPSKEFKKWKLYCKNACTTGIAAAPYSKDYYVTIP